MALSRVLSEIYWVPALGVKNLEWWGYRADKEAWRYLQRCGYNPPTWQTDRQTDARADTGRQQRPRLRIASRGNNETTDCNELADCERVLKWDHIPHL